MKSYGLMERWIAKSLESFPVVKKAGKMIYQRIHYAYNKQPGFSYAIHPSAKILEPNEWAGMDSKVPHSWIYFGYYDKSPWSKDMSRAVFQQEKQTNAEVVVFDRNRGKIIRAGSTSAFNEQQGSMVQWLNGSANEIIFNNIFEDTLGSTICCIESGDHRNIPWPVQTLHPQLPIALTLNYKRLDRLRPEYGYPMVVRNFNARTNEREDGIWQVDLRRGSAELIISLEQLMKHEPRMEMSDSDHKVNHIMFSPNGTRFVFMHRWLGKQGKFSRLYSANGDGTGLRLLLDERMVSHYSWKNEDELIVWARMAKHGDRYYLINVIDGSYTMIGEDKLDVFGDGHPSYSPDGKWIVTDTYPDKARQRHLLLYDTATDRLVTLGSFFAPWAFDGAKRCDLHPRWSPDGRWISVDSAHTGVRRTYVIDVSKIVGGDVVD